MRILKSLSLINVALKELKRKDYVIGFVPTMGALHKGHISLIQASRKECDKVVVSIFVNSIQFGPKEDFKKYPRNFKEDVKLCREEGVDIIFYPAAKDMYSPDYKTYVNVEGLSNVLCGKSRVGHFKGVATVVTKFFNIVNPDVAYFGQKDAQQAIIIKKMVEDLNIPVRIKVMPTVREEDGLAMSSRNAYLNKQERQDAAVLYQALTKALDLIRQGNRDSLDIIRKMRRLINKRRNANIQYISIVCPQDLKPMDKIRGKVLIALAVFIGKTRLIDNIVVKP